jgi:hypothetical protein
MADQAPSPLTSAERKVIFASPLGRECSAIYYGLWYPIVVAVMTLIIGLLFIRETKDVDIYQHD